VIVNLPLVIEPRFSSLPNGSALVFERFVEFDGSEMAGSFVLLAVRDGALKLVHLPVPPLPRSSSLSPAHHSAASGSMVPEQSVLTAPTGPGEHIAPATPGPITLGSASLVAVGRACGSAKSSSSRS
jgi:hypothetical protein